MSDRLIMRSVYLRESEDVELRQIAYEINRTKSDLIRAAISNNLEVWRKLNDPDAILRHVEALDKDAGDGNDDIIEHELRSPEQPGTGNLRPVKRVGTDSRPRRADSPRNTAAPGKVVLS